MNERAQHVALSSWFAWLRASSSTSDLLTTRLASLVRVLVLQIRIVSSKPPLASSVPSSLNETDMHQLLCAKPPIPTFDECDAFVSVPMTSPYFTSYKKIVPYAPESRATANNVPPGENRTHRTVDNELEDVAFFRP
ncbi:hypothetical protein OGATHE_004504 [Ogataea polymorpha]|uniref:Uncharacterized protein n=1 Tax=Ogataea polymorpha TaxID=460523 RepID=A0A9P8T1L1_9ASCO|nr:hypothetical protein OGATHE_004504 [Ogataea polymorpha]